MSVPTFKRFLFTVFAFLIFAASAKADERILRFLADLEVQADGQLIVTETITVMAEGQEIRRGIFRDIPLRQRDANGWQYEVGFELLDVRQDGERASYFTKPNTAGIRIYIGREDVFLDPGEYTYTIRYAMDRQIRFFSDYDEIYWNVTGNEWIFPIDEAVARISLPQGAVPSQYAAYTGVFGADGADYEAEVDPGTNDVVVRTSRSLEPYEGLTVAVGFPKGFAIEPSASEKLSMWLQDQRIFAIGASGISILLLYYLISWWLVGRDPAKGVIYPRFKAPEGISPALANYITNRGIEGGRWTALSAAVLSLAVKGRLDLDKDGKAMVLSVTDKVQDDANSALPKGEAVLESFLKDRGSPLEISSKNGETISTIGEKFVGAINREYTGVYFRRNGWYLLPGLFASILVGASLFYFGNLSDEQFAQAFLFGFFTIFTIAISVGLTMLVQSLVKSVTGLQIMAVGFWLIFAGIAGTGIYLVSLLVAFMTGNPQEIPLLPLFLFILVGMFIGYANVIDIPTQKGREVMDAIDGLKLYLSVAEKDRLNMADAPDMSVVHFEKLLPYAVSLGVEKPWAESFQTWLTAATAHAGNQDYRPR
ncbi:DUF2207 domain-containing protein, partial [Roseibium denhamense]